MFCLACVSGLQSDIMQKIEKSLDVSKEESTDGWMDRCPLSKECFINIYG